MFYADTVGVDNVYEFMAKLYEQQGEWVKPAPLLEKSPKKARASRTTLTRIEHEPELSVEHALGARRPAQREPDMSLRSLGVEA